MDYESLTMAQKLIEGMRELTDSLENHVGPDYIPRIHKNGYVTYEILDDISRIWLVTTTDDKIAARIYFCYGYITIFVGAAMLTQYKIEENITTAFPKAFEKVVEFWKQYAKS